MDHKARLDREVFLAEAKSPLEARQDAEGKLRKEVSVVTFEKKKDVR